MQNSLKFKLTLYSLLFYSYSPTIGFVCRNQDKHMATTIKFVIVLKHNAAAEKCQEEEIKVVALIFFALSFLIYFNFTQ